MEEFACLGILDPGGGTENVYDKLLATIDKEVSFLRSLINPLFKNIPHVGSF